jgi:hypothetical protein
MKRFFVLYADGPEMDTWDIEAEFDSLKQAESWVKKQNQKEDANGFGDSASWEYHILQWVSGTKTEVKVNKCLETYALKLKGGSK